MSEERSRMEADAKIANKHRADAWISECLPEVYLLEQEKAVWLQLRNAGQRKRRAHNALLRSMAPMPFDEWAEAEQLAQAEREQQLQEKVQSQMQRQALESSRAQNVGVFLQQEMSSHLCGKLRESKQTKLPTRYKEQSHPQPEVAIGGLIKAKTFAKKAGGMVAKAKAFAAQKESEAGGALAWARSGKIEKV